MKHYVSPEGEIFAYEEDGSQDHLIPEGFREVSGAELDGLRRPTPLTAGEARAIRDARLTASDWTQGRDVPESLSAKWAPYRQALRDLPTAAGFPESIAWPNEPVN